MGGCSAHGRVNKEQGAWLEPGRWRAVTGKELVAGNECVHAFRVAMHVCACVCMYVSVCVHTSARACRTCILGTCEGSIA